MLRGAEPGELPVIGAPEDVRRALAEGGWSVKPRAPLHDAALPQPSRCWARARPQQRALHEVRADYGELPAAKVPPRRCDDES